jgi:glucosamine-6-phosphate deaminase
MKDIYAFDFSDPKTKPPLPCTVFESDVDLYHDIALTLYSEIEENNRKRKHTAVILPVGPVFQYRRFVLICRKRPLDLSTLHCFFMDEYCDEKGELIDRSNPLSFRGFIERELVQAMPEEMQLNPHQVYFPDPKNLEAYDERLAKLGNADTCYAGVGINGHLAFNEPPEPEENTNSEEFAALPTRLIALSRETVVINSTTAMRGAFERVPQQAVTVGMKQILAARRIRVYLNRPWQSSVVRKILFAPISASFPATLIREHGDAALGLTRLVAEKPEFALK